MGPSIVAGMGHRSGFYQFSPDHEYKFEHPSGSSSGPGGSKLKEMKASVELGRKYAERSIAEGKGAKQIGKEVLATTLQTLWNATQLVLAIVGAFSVMIISYVSNSFKSVFGGDAPNVRQGSK